MVTHLPFMASSGTVYDIETYEIVETTEHEVKGHQEQVQVSFFVALVKINGSEKYRTTRYPDEDSAAHDAFTWSKAQEKKAK